MTKDDVRDDGAPVAAAKPAMRLVFPTPGLPSSSTALCSCNALSTRHALRAVAGASKLMRPGAVEPRAPVNSPSGPPGGVALSI